MKQALSRLAPTFLCSVAMLAAGCGAEGEIGLGVGFITPSAHDVVSDALYVSLGEPEGFEDGIAFYVNGRQVDRDLLPPFEAWIDTTDLEDGPIRVTARPARDERASPIDEVVVIVDNRGPTIAFDAPMAGDCIPAHTALTVSARVEDDVGVRAAELRVDGEAVAVFEDAPYALTVPPSSLVESLGTEHQLTIAAENARGRITNASLTVAVCAD